MIQIRPSFPEELAAQKALWRSAFGDEDAYIDWFYTCFRAPEDILLLLEDGATVSMLALLPMELRFPAGTCAHAFYIYALATDPRARNRGYGRQLLYGADDYLRARGADCATVVPAEPSLHRFFAGTGFSPGFSLRTATLVRAQFPPAGAGTVEPVAPAVYNRIRDRLLQGSAYIHYGEESIRYQAGMSRMGGADLYRVAVDGAEGCAAAEYADDGHLLLKELVIPPARMAGAVGLLTGALPAERCTVRTPADWDGFPGSHLQPFGQIKWYNPELAALWQQDPRAYLGLGFD